MATNPLTACHSISAATVNNLKYLTITYCDSGLGAEPAGGAAAWQFDNLVYNASSTNFHPENGLLITA
jgi:hypothetical protein